ARTSTEALDVQRVDPTELGDAVVLACLAALDDEGSVGLIAADTRIRALAKALDAAAATPYRLLGADTEDTGSQRLSLVPVTVAKGLEFDHVVVIEPAEIVAAEQRGLHRLYVALTRAVSALTVVHAEPLPEPLRS